MLEFWGQVLEKKKYLTFTDFQTGCQKLDIILEKQGVLKLKLSKQIINKKDWPKVILSNGKNE